MSRPAADSRVQRRLCDEAPRRDAIWTCSGRSSAGVVDAIVVPSGSCAAMVTHFYSALFEDPSMAAERRRAEELAWSPSS